MTNLLHKKYKFVTVRYKYLKKSHVNLNAPRVRRFKQLYFGKHPELGTCSYERFSHNDVYYHLPKY